MNPSFHEEEGRVRVPRYIVSNGFVTLEFDSENDAEDATSFLNGEIS